MIDLFSLCGIGLIVVISAQLLKIINSEYVKWIIAAFVLLCFVSIIPLLSDTVAFVKNAADKGNSEYIGIILKALGITYLTSTARELCKCGGEELVGENIETVGKIEILVLSLPLFKELLEIAII